MGDRYWSHGSARYQAPPEPAPAAAVKRPRSDYADVSGGPELASYYDYNEEKVIYHGRREAETLGTSFDRYESVTSVEDMESARSRFVDMPRQPIRDRIRLGVRGTDEQTVEYRGSRRENSLPSDASRTLYVEGLPANCTRREVSHVFRPFPGFLEVRIVNKESRHAGDDPWVLCFVDFSSPSQAAVALECLEGYKFDEHDRESLRLKLQFSRCPGPKSARIPRGKQ